MPEGVGEGVITVIFGISISFAIWIILSYIYYLITHFYFVLHTLGSIFNTFITLKITL